MPWYVYALVDAIPSAHPGRGLSGPLRILDVAGGFAVVERRADVPPPEFGSLGRHQSIVMRIANAVPAILPVRFGTLLDDDELEEALADRKQEVREAFTLVRHRVQFTWRRREARGARRKPEGARVGPVRSTKAGGAGAQYLRRAAQAASPAPPPEFRTPLARLRVFVAREKFQPAAAGVPDTLYQLIDRSAESRYRELAETLMLTSPSFSVSGPWPPFAFAPEVL